MDANGLYVYDSNSIKAEALTYYQQLFNGEIMHFFPTVNTRMVINDMGKEFLSSLITLEKVQTALFFIDDAKSPGTDGFSPKFYKLPCTDL